MKLENDAKVSFSHLGRVLYSGHMAELLKMVKILILLWENNYVFLIRSVLYCKMVIFIFVSFKVANETSKKY